MNTRRAFLRNMLSMGAATAVAPSMVLANPRPWEAIDCQWYWEVMDYGHNSMLSLFFPFPGHSYAINTYMRIETAKKHESMHKRLLFNYAMEQEEKRYNGIGRSIGEAENATRNRA